MRRTTLAVVVLTAICGPGGANADTVDGPMYKEWAVWREGATTTVKSESSFQGMLVTVSTTTQILKKLTADKAVIETTSVIEAGGQKVAQGPIAMEIPAKVPKVEFKSQPEEKPAEAPKYKETKGRETLTIAGQKVNCEWVQIELEGGTTMKTWTSDDVPSRLVKMTSNDPTNMATSTTMLVDFKATKR